MEKKLHNFLLEETNFFENLMKEFDDEELWKKYMEDCLKEKEERKKRTNSKKRKKRK
jgi:hypothetical protein